MQYTQGQTEALEAIDKLKQKFPNGGGVLVINGLAGTGKSSLIKAVADQVGDILVLAPTGKAALRVRDVAFCRTSTVHRWLYSPVEDEQTGDIIFTRKTPIEIEGVGFHSLIIDEASMVSKELYEDLHEICCLSSLNLILIGDEFQLPPVEDDFSVFSPKFQPDMRVDLTEILRQGLDSPIIRTAAALRSGVGYMKEMSSLPMVDFKDLIDESINVWSNDGVIICHKNETRHKINSEIRKSLGRLNTVEDKEPLLITKNNYTLDLFNGEVHIIKSIQDNIGFKKISDKFSGKTCWVNFIRIQLANGDYCVIGQEELNEQTEGIWPKALERQSRSLAKKIAKKEGLLTEPTYIHANYGYGLTCHKAQGSEWDEGLVVFESSINTATADGRRWAYTALSRFKKNVKIVWKI